MICPDGNNAFWLAFLIPKIKVIVERILAENTRKKSIVVLLFMFLTHAKLNVIFKHYLRLFLRYFNATDISTITKINKQVAQRATIAHLSPMCQGQILFKKSGDTDVLDAQGQLTP